MAECCDVCGDDSYRCARGPCSTAFVPAKIFSMSVPTEDVSFWDVIMVMLTIMPYMVPVFLALDFLFWHHTWARLVLLMFIPICALVNIIVVKILTAAGGCPDCPRPCGSCNEADGMPSGHSANGVGFVLYVLLEYALGCGRDWDMRWKVAVSVFLMIILLPVPYSRIFLGDHTVVQVLIGCAEGIVFAILWFILFRKVVAHRMDGVNEYFGRTKYLHFIHLHNDYYVTPWTPSANNETIGTEDVSLVENGNASPRSDFNPSNEPK